MWPVVVYTAVNPKQVKLIPDEYKTNKQNKKRLNSVDVAVQFTFWSNIWAYKFNAGLNTSQAEVTLIHEPGAKRGSCIYGTIDNTGGHFEIVGGGFGSYALTRKVP